MFMELNYKEFGSGSPVVVLHGLFGTLDNWQTIGKQLAERHTVFLIDLRNHGQSPHVPTISYPEMADDIRQFMEAHWIYSAAVIGHSMGGKVAMTLALEYPDFVSRLAVIDIAPKYYSGGHEGVFDTLASLDLTQLESRQQAETYLSSRIADKPTVQFLMKNLSRNGTEGTFKWKMNFDIIKKDYANILSPIGQGADPYLGPSLFVRGGKSDYIKDDDFSLIRGLFPFADIKTVPNVGHWVHAEAPTALLHHFIDFLD